MTNTDKILEEFVEEGADLEHNRWARWHKYSRLMATPAHIEMWDRKAEMPYIALTNEEQESDRKETRNYLPLLEKAIAQAIAEERENENTATVEAIKNLSRLTFQTHITDDIRTTASMLLTAHYDEQKSKYIRDLEFRIKKEHQALAEERDRVRGMIEKYNPKSLDTGVAGKIEESIFQRVKDNILSSLDKEIINPKD